MSFEFSNRDLYRNKLQEIADASPDALSVNDQGQIQVSKNKLFDKISGFGSKLIGRPSPSSSRLVEIKVMQLLNYGVDQNWLTNKDRAVIDKIAQKLGLVAGSKQTHKELHKLITRINEALTTGNTLSSKETQKLTTQFYRRHRSELRPFEERVGKPPLANETPFLSESEMMKATHRFTPEGVPVVPPGLAHSGQAPSKFKVALVAMLALSGIPIIQGSEEVAGLAPDSTSLALAQKHTFSHPQCPVVLPPEQPVVTHPEVAAPVIEIPWDQQVHDSFKELVAPSDGDVPSANRELREALFFEYFSYARAYTDRDLDLIIKLMAKSGGDEIQKYQKFIDWKYASIFDPYKMPEDRYIKFAINYSKISIDTFQKAVNDLHLFGYQKEAKALIEEALNDPERIDCTQRLELHFFLDEKEREKYRPIMHSFYFQRLQTCGEKYDEKLHLRRKRDFNSYLESFSLDDMAGQRPKVMEEVHSLSLFKGSCSDDTSYQTRDLANSYLLRFQNEYFDYLMTLPDGLDLIRHFISRVNNGINDLEKFMEKYTSHISSSITAKDVQVLLDYAHRQARIDRRLALMDRGGEPGHSDNPPPVVALRGRKLIVSFLSANPANTELAGKFLNELYYCRQQPDEDEWQLLIDFYKKRPSISSSQASILQNDLVKTEDLNLYRLYLSNIQRYDNITSELLSKYAVLVGSDITEEDLQIILKVKKWASDRDKIYVVKPILENALAQYLEKDISKFPDLLMEYLEIDGNMRDTVEGLVKKYFELSDIPNSLAFLSRIDLFVPDDYSLKILNAAADQFINLARREDVRDVFRQYLSAYPEKDYSEEIDWFLLKAIIDEHVIWEPDAYAYLLPVRESLSIPTLTARKLASRLLHREIDGLRWDNANYKAIISIVRECVTQNTDTAGEVLDLLTVDAIQNFSPRGIAAMMQATADMPESHVAGMQLKARVEQVADELLAQQGFVASKDGQEFMMECFKNSMTAEMTFNKLTDDQKNQIALWPIKNLIQLLINAPNIQIGLKLLSAIHDSLKDPWGVILCMLAGLSGLRQTTRDMDNVSRQLIGGVFNAKNLSPKISKEDLPNDCRVVFREKDGSIIRAFDCNLALLKHESAYFKKFIHFFERKRKSKKGNPLVIDLSNLVSPEYFAMALDHIYGRQDFFKRSEILDYVQSDLNLLSPQMHNFEPEKEKKSMLPKDHDEATQEEFFRLGQLPNEGMDAIGLDYFLLKPLSREVDDTYRHDVENSPMQKVRIGRDDLMVGADIELEIPRDLWERHQMKPPREHIKRSLDEEDEISVIRNAGIGVKTHEHLQQLLYHQDTSHLKTSQDCIDLLLLGRDLNLTDEILGLVGARYVELNFKDISSLSSKPDYEYTDDEKKIADELNNMPISHIDLSKLAPDITDEQFSAMITVLPKVITPFIAIDKCQHLNPTKALLFLVTAYNIPFEDSLQAFLTVTT